MNDNGTIWLPDDELTREWLEAVEEYRRQCDVADRRRILGEGSASSFDEKGGFMARYLFTVESFFTIQGRGLVVLPGVEDYATVRFGDPLELRRPDGSIVRTMVQGVEYPPSLKWVEARPDAIQAGILLGSELMPADVPPGTQVWAIERN